MMEKVKALNVAIVGGGPGCKAIMDMIFAEKLSQLRMKLIGVACTNPKAVGYRYAQEKGIYTTQDYRDLYKLKNLNMIIELTGREEVANEIFRTKPEHVRLMGNVAARLFWDIFQIEEQRIAERKRAEEETRKRKEYLESIMDSSMDLILTVNKDGTLNFANKRIGNIFGYRSEDIKGRRFIEFIPEEMHSFVQEKWSEVQKGIGGSYETKVIKADGSIIDCLVSHSKLKGLDEYLAILKDIADHKRAEEALRESEARSRLILQTMPSGLFTVDLERKITSWNKEAEEIIGPKAEEVIGKDCLEVLECVECKKGCVLLDDKVDKPIYGKECVIHIDGEDIIISKNMDILRNSEGNTIGGLEIFINITERKRAEKEKKKLEAQLQHAQKMEAIGTLAGGIAHDFNNLLMGIQGNVSLIEKQVQSGVKLTQQLLGYARKGRYEVKPIDLNQLVEETSETFSRTNKEITIHQELAKDLFAIEADLGQIEQVLLNLYVNAADAMHGGGNLILKTMNTAHKDMKGKLYDPKPGNYVLLTVTDTGTGMDKETIERIFDPFFTTKKMGRGTGLGLASAYGIIKGHGGYIDVESNKGRGTTFSIYLPASEKKIQKAGYS
ncbi:MAG: PAS domain S-box protein [Deltaproteobacteria bacterium]|nr:PAS domain S-box protein [Deltaproteobacteria bacterium]